MSITKLIEKIENRKNEQFDGEASFTNVEIDLLISIIKKQREALEKIKKGPCTEDDDCAACYAYKILNETDAMAREVL